MKLFLILLSAAGVILALCVILILAALIRTLLMPSKVSSYRAPEADERALGYARKLSEMVQCETISHDQVH